MDVKTNMPCKITDTYPRVTLVGSVDVAEVGKMHDFRNCLLDPSTAGE